VQTLDRMQLLCLILILINTEIIDAFLSNPFKRTNSGKVEFIGL